MTNSELSRAECAALRGLAIIGIFLHNYCHWLGPAVKENEYTFRARNVEGLTHAITRMDSMWFVHFISFFGHYGVPVFLFLSAYGLARKYEASALPDAGRGVGAWLSETGRFVAKHFWKLFGMMFLGFALFTTVDLLAGGAHHYHLSDVVSQLFLVNNLMPDPDHIIWPGPYWFFGLMLQFYVLYALVLRRAHWGVVVGLIAVCWVAQAVCEPESETLNRLRYNCIGGMLPFGLGLLYARYVPSLQMKRSVLAVVAVVSALLIYALSLTYQTWYVVPAFVCLGALTLVKAVPAALLRPLEWVGALSAALFVVHPTARKVFIPLSRGSDVWTGLLLYIIASVALALLFRKLTQRAPKGA